MEPKPHNGKVYMEPKQHDMETKQRGMLCREP